MLRLFSDAPPCLDVDVDDLIFFYEIPRKKKGEFKWVFFFLQQFLVINKHVSTNTATGSGTTHREGEKPSPSNVGWPYQNATSALLQLERHGRDFIDLFG
jgi:hypothetical protein